MQRQAMQLPATTLYAEPAAATLMDQILAEAESPLLNAVIEATTAPAWCVKYDHACSATDCRQNSKYKGR